MSSSRDKAYSNYSGAWPLMRRQELLPPSHSNTNQVQAPLINLSLADPTLHHDMPWTPSYTELCLHSVLGWTCFMAFSYPLRQPCGLLVTMFFPSLLQAVSPTDPRALLSLPGTWGERMMKVALTWRKIFSELWTFFFFNYVTDIQYWCLFMSYSVIIQYVYITRDNQNFHCLKCHPFYRLGTSSSLVILECWQFCKWVVDSFEHS
jgi:hypothetical protein